MLAAAEVFLLAREGNGPYLREAASPQRQTLHLPPLGSGTLTVAVEKGAILAVKVMRSTRGNVSR
jgi:hypothetical protein